ncbi:MAG: chromosomal replication initiator protein DnaA [Candidatus Dojkabacteria bacterium]
MKITDPKQLWKVSLAQIEIKLDAPAQFKMFFQDTKLLKVEGKLAVIGVPNPYTSEWLKSRYENLIRDTLTYVYGDTLNPMFEVYQREMVQEDFKKDDNSSPLLSMENGVMGSVIELVTKAGLNPKYSMSNYIVGNSNRIGHAAALAVVDRPGQSYNPLFVYGKTGVGKTHLAQSVGRSVLERNLRAKVLYVSSEGFLNDMVKGIKSGNSEKMRQKYRQIDILIIDDMQLISKWVNTQTEFFNTFNELHNAGKQVILIADRRPEDIQNLESRLRSRMQGGMVVEIAQPDYETRLAILQRRADSSGYDLKQQILEFIAKAVNDNVRELEGALQKVALFNQMKPEGDLTLEEVAHTIGRDAKTRREQVKVPKVLKEVSRSFGVTVKDVKGPRRTKELALARQVAMFILREEFNYKLEEVAKFLNRQDHTTVLHAIDKIKSKMMIQEGFNSQVSHIITAIQEAAAVSDDFE